MDYGNLIKRSWEIVWDHKFMFVLGFLAALGGGRTGGGGRGSARYNMGSGDITPAAIDKFQHFWAHYGALVIVLICVGVIVGIVLWLVRLTAQTGMIEAVSRIESGEKVTLGQALAAGAAKLGRMVGINVVMYGPFTFLGLLMFGGFTAVFIPAVTAQASGANPVDLQTIFGALGVVGVCMAVVGCLMVPLLLFVSLIYPFAQRGAVLQDLGVISSIQHGWQVVKDNVSDVVLLVVLFIALGFVFGLAALVVLFPFAIVTLGPGIVSMVVSEGAFGFSQIALLAGGGICVGLVGAAVNSIMVAFRSTAVTLAYQEFAKKVTVQVSP